MTEATEIAEQWPVQIYATQPLVLEEEWMKLNEDWRKPDLSQHTHICLIAGFLVATHCID
jgi:hypothetical protein